MSDNQSGSTKNLGSLKDLGLSFFSEGTKKLKIPVISTSSLLLNKALGIGGWPESKIIEIFGVDSSGKTTLCLHAVAEAQKLGKTVVYMDVENTLNPDWAKRIGVDMDKLLIARPENGEKAFELINRIVETKEVGLIVVDSVAALVPSYEFENSIEDQTMGLHARLMSKGLRILQSLMINSPTTIIFINQVRDRIGNSFIPMTTTTGGRALKYAASVRVEVKKCESIKDSNNQAIGFVTKFVVVKNKFGAPLVSVNSGLYFDTGIDTEYEVIGEALDKKILVKKGSWISYKDKNLAQGVVQLRKKIKENKELLEELLEKAFEIKKENTY